MPTTKSGIGFPGNFLPEVEISVIPNCFCNEGILTEMKIFAVTFL
jgi:hypothetical protein